MKGIILVGGLGTRLRPLTLTQPKPLVPFANKPMVVHQLEALAEAGVDEVILAVGHMQDHLKEVLDEYEEKLNIKITYSVEESPMGTAGAFSLLRYLLQEETEPFFVLNSDVTCCYPFKEMKKYHADHKGEGTILVTKVENPSKYGVIVTDSDARIRRFVEKPETFVGNSINAGIYLFNKTILDYIEDRPMSMETDVLPQMVKERVVKTFTLEGFWMDIGQPRDYIKGQILYLSNCMGEYPIIIDPSAKISPKATIGNNTVIGPNVVVESGAEIENSVIFEGSIIRQNVLISNSIIGWKCTIGEWSRIEEYSVLGSQVQVQNGIYITGGIIQPSTFVSLHVLIPTLASELTRNTTPCEDYSS